MTVPPRGGTRLAGGRRFACAALALALVAVSPVRADYTYVSTSGGVKHGCAPQYHEDNITEAFHKTDAQAMVVGLDVDTCEPANAAGDVARSEFTFNQADLTAVSGKIAVIRGSACLFGTYDSGDGDYEDPYVYYLQDFQRRVDAVVAAGAIGVIWGEGKAGKIPEQMVGHLINSDSFNQATPVCTMEKAVFDAFTDDHFTTNQVTSIDTTNIPMYREEDEQFPDPRLTYLTVEEPWKPGGPNGYEFPMPAKTATFGPTDAAAKEAELVEAVFIDACVSDEYEACANECWAAVAGGTTPFTQNLTGKIALFEDEEEAEDNYGCFPLFSSWAQLAQKFGALAIVHGTHADVSSWYYAGPYQVPFDLTIPFFSLMRPHTEMLESARDESAAHASHDVTLKTPAVAGGAGPDYFADADVEFGPAPVLMWRDDTDHFYCDAGQAVFNPAPWGGLPLPSNGNRLVTLFPSDACAAANVGDVGCGECLAGGASTQIAQLWARVGGVSATVNASATVEGVAVAQSSDVPSDARAAFGDDFVAVVFLQDFTCFTSYEEFAAVAEATGASATLLVMSESYPYLAPHMYAIADVDAGGQPLRRTVPTFSVTFACAMRALQGAADARADLPAIGADGDASIGPHAHSAGYYVPNTQEMETTAFGLLEAPSGLCGGDGGDGGGDIATTCAAGQANFNPESYPAVRAEALLVRTAEACQSWWTCLQCDRLADEAEETQTYLRYLDREDAPLLKVDVAGRVVFVMERDLRCAHPYTNFVRDMEANHALAVLIGLESQNVETLTATAVPFNTTVPTFTLRNADAVAFEAALLSGADVSVLTPVLVGGAADEDSVASASVSAGTLRLGKNHGGTFPGSDANGGGARSRIGAGEIVGFFVLVGAIIGVGVAAVAARRSSARGQRLVPAWLRDATRGMRSFGGSPNAPSAERGTAAGAGAAGRAPPATRANPYAQFEDEPYPDDARGYAAERFSARGAPRTEEPAAIPAPGFPPGPVEAEPGAANPFAAEPPAPTIPIPPSPPPSSPRPPARAGDVELVPAAGPSPRAGLVDAFDAAAAPYPPASPPPGGASPRSPE